MIKLIKKFFQKRKLKKQIRQSSFNCQSMEMASDKEFEEMNFAEHYETERTKLDNLRKKLNSL